MKTKQEFETEYIGVKADIKANIVMIKNYTENIQKCRLEIDELSKTLTDLQQQYLDAGYGKESEKNDSSKESKENTSTSE